MSKLSEIGNFKTSNRNFEFSAKCSLLLSKDEGYSYKQTAHFPRKFSTLVTFLQLLFISTFILFYVDTLTYCKSRGDEASAISSR